MPETDVKLWLGSHLAVANRYRPAVGILLFAVGLFMMAILFPLAAPREALTWWTFWFVWPLSVTVVLLGFVDLTEPGFRGEITIAIGVATLILAEAARKRWGAQF